MARRPPRTGFATSAPLGVALAIGEPVGGCEPVAAEPPDGTTAGTVEFPVPYVGAGGAALVEYGAGALPELE